MTPKELMDLFGVSTSLRRPVHPRVVDDDEGIISVTLKGKELRGWVYDNDDMRRTKMLLAREYVEGWCDATDKLFSALDAIANTGTSTPDKR